MDNTCSELEIILRNIWVLYICFVRSNLTPKETLKREAVGDTIWPWQLVRWKSPQKLSSGTHKIFRAHPDGLSPAGAVHVPEHGPVHRTGPWRHVRHVVDRWQGHWLCPQADLHTGRAAQTQGAPGGYAATAHVRVSTFVYLAQRSWTFSITQNIKERLVVLTIIGCVGLI